MARRAVGTHTAHTSRTTWRWAGRGALLVGTFTALTAVLVAFVVLREPPQIALAAYAVGAAAGAFLGFALGNLLGHVWTSVRRRTRTSPRRPVAWVAHRRQAVG